MADELRKLASRASSVAIFDVEARWELFETPMSSACTEYAMSSALMFISRIGLPTLFFFCDFCLLFISLKHNYKIFAYLL